MENATLLSSERGRGGLAWMAEERGSAVDLGLPSPIMAMAGASTSLLLAARQRC